MCFLSGGLLTPLNRSDPCLFSVVNCNFLTIFSYRALLHCSISYRQFLSKNIFTARVGKALTSAAVLLVTCGMFVAFCSPEILVEKNFDYFETAYAYRVVVARRKVSDSSCQASIISWAGIKGRVCAFCLSLLLLMSKVQKMVSFLCRENDSFSIHKDCFFKKMAKMVVKAYFSLSEQVRTYSFRGKFA